METNKDIVYTTSYLKRKHTCGEFIYKSIGSKAMERGSIIHEMLELGVTKYNKGGSTYRGVFRPYQFEHNFEEYKAIANMVVDKEPHLFTDKWKNEVTLNTTTSKGHKISGIVDTMNISGSVCTMIDWKTGYSRASKNVEIDMLQALMYLYIVFQNYPYITEAKFTYYYVESTDRLPITATTSDIKNLEVIIEKYIAIANKRGLELNSSCHYCKNYDSCPLISDKLTKLNTLDMKELKIMEKVIKARKEDIKEDWLKDEDKKDKNFYNKYSYYVKKDDLDKEQLCCCVKEDIKVSKALCEKFKKEGVEIIERKVVVVKPSAN